MTITIKNNKVYNEDGEVAILYSPGYGAGWYTWNSENKEILTNPQLVQMVLNDERSKITDSFMQKLLNTKSFYSGGARDLQVEWMTEGQHFRIEEYDGSERILYKDDISLVA